MASEISPNDGGVGAEKGKQGEEKEKTFLEESDAAKEKGGKIYDIVTFFTGERTKLEDFYVFIIQVLMCMLFTVLTNKISSD